MMGLQAHPPSLTVTDAYPSCPAPLTATDGYLCYR